MIIQKPTVTIDAFGGTGYVANTGHYQGDRRRSQKGWQQVLPGKGNLVAGEIHQFRHGRFQTGVVDDAPLHETPQMPTTDHVGTDRTHEAQPQAASRILRQHAKTANDHNVQPVPGVVQNGVFPATQ